MAPLYAFGALGSTSDTMALALRSPATNAGAWAVNHKSPSQAPWLVTRSGTHESAWSPTPRAAPIWVLGHSGFMVLDREEGARLYEEALMFLAIQTDLAFEEIAETGRLRDLDFIVGIADERLGQDFGLSRIVQLMLEEDALDSDAAGPLAVRAWNKSSAPLSSIPIQTWRDLFDIAGFTHKGLPADRPTEPLTLYRGCGPSGEHGWSWTADRDTAQRFADQFGAIGQVVERQWEPEHLLASIDPAVNSESEWIVDTGENPQPLCCLVEGRPRGANSRTWTPLGLWRPGFPDVVMVGDTALAFIDLT